jgi:hypothetical protein
MMSSRPEGAVGSCRVWPPRSRCAPGGRGSWAEIAPRCAACEEDYRQKSKDIHWRVCPAWCQLMWLRSEASHGSNSPRSCEVIKPLLGSVRVRKGSSS